MRVRLCVAASLDGKISSAAREPVSFTSRADRGRLFALRDEADVTLHGAATLRAEDPPLLPSAERRAARVAAGRRPNPVRAVVSRSLDLPLDGRALRDELEAPVVIFTTADADPDRVAALEARGFEVVLGPGSAFDPAAALRHLSAQHAAVDLLSEGGGVLNAALLEAGVVDEIHLTLCPLVLGGAAAPTPVDGAGFRVGDAPRWTLTHVEQVNQELFLTYEVARAP